MNAFTSTYRPTRPIQEGELFLGEIPEEDKELARQIHRLLSDAVKVPHQLRVVAHKYLNSYIFLETSSSVLIDVSELSKTLEHITDVYSVRCDLRKPEKFFIIKFKSKSAETTLPDLKKGEAIETMEEFSGSPTIHGERIMEREYLRQDAADLIHILAKNIIHSCVPDNTDLNEFWRFEMVQKNSLQLVITNCCSLVNLQEMNHIVQEYQTKATAQSVLPNKARLFVNLLDGSFLTESDKEEVPLLLDMGPGWVCELQTNDGTYKIIVTHESEKVSIIATHLSNEYKFDHEQTHMVPLTDVVKLEICGPGVLKRREEYGRVIECPVTKEAFCREAEKDIKIHLNAISRAFGESVE